MSAVPPWRPRPVHRPPVLSTSRRRERRAGARGGDAVRVDAGHLLRTARRAAGLSQRQLAERSGLPLTSIAEVEAGRRGLPVEAVRRALVQAGLDLAVIPCARLGPMEETALRAHLRSSLVQRLHQGLGGRGRPQTDRSPMWSGLWQLSLRASVLLTGPAAVSVWLPVRAACCQVVLHPLGTVAGRPPAPPATVEGLIVTTSQEALPRGTVQVGLGPAVLHVLPPALLSTVVDGAAQRQALLAAARLLDREAPRDAQGRRAAAHRGVRPWWDQEAVEEQRGGTSRRVPAPDNRRGWQLDGPVSRAQWVRRAG